MGDFFVIILLLGILALILRYLYQTKIQAKRKGLDACIGCSGGSCSSCDPMTLKENLKQELHKNSCCH